jgi:hypothetical protein
MIPELKVGVAILTNQESEEAFEAIAYNVLDRYVGGTKTDWLDAFKKLRSRRNATVDASEKLTMSKRDSTSHPSLPLDSYAGTYNDAWYGDINIAFEKGRLVMKFGHTPSLEGELQHWQYDTFIAKWKDRELRADAFVTFSLNPDGSIDQAKMRAVSPATDFSFDFQDLVLKPVKRLDR